MARQVRRRRGTTADHASWIGADGEITVDTTKKTLVVHDGATPGGFPLARGDFAGTDVVRSIQIRQIVVLFEQVYNSLAEKDPETFYVVTPAILRAETVVLEMRIADMSFMVI